MLGLDNKKTFAYSHAFDEYVRQHDNRRYQARDTLTIKHAKYNVCFLFFCISSLLEIMTPFDQICEQCLQCVFCLAAKEEAKIYY